MVIISVPQNDSETKLYKTPKAKTLTHLLDFGVLVTISQPPLKQFGFFPHSQEFLPFPSLQQLCLSDKFC